MNVFLAIPKKYKSQTYKIIKNIGVILIHICSICQKRILENQKKQICAECNSYFHSTCLKFEDEEIKAVAGEVIIQRFYVCSKCGFKTILSKTENKKEIKIVNKFFSWFFGLIVVLLMILLLSSLFFN
ncbi:MAG: hypothetical protein BAJALOKI2v1_1070002 [Promethearchaeota archaeon]|nr:MAG: hypothetical protein BAJALOKI2v1_1070002 [Candidatus Lokiarchaeota archaeon]